MSEQNWVWGDKNNCSLNGDFETNPIHQHGSGYWWFYDETWSQELGPFETEELAKQACKDYMRCL